ncbi:MAG: DNA replication and repair protein RecF, partial [Fimbriimonadaceae bacterium]|nr:DNA replication and repair protein RecF [Chitinophagales bacterium]
MNYKNYRNIEIVFDHPFILINGDNGAGKTNLIDAVHYLCICKSYFTRQDDVIVHHKENFFRLDGDFDSGEENFSITCKYQKDKKKEFFKNDLLYDKLSEHVGLIPVVMIAPGDIEIINGGSEERRRFIDAAIAQIDHAYLRFVIEYNKILAQRNSLLKQFYLNGRNDDTLMNVLNNQLAERGNKIYARRKKFIDDFKADFITLYKLFSSDAEHPDLKYESQLTEHDHLNLLLHSKKQDAESQRTTFGIHKDDLKFSVDSFALKESGSQGQIKSFLIALKLVLAKMMYNTTQKKPILLLDDVF